MFKSKDDTLLKGNLANILVMQLLNFILIFPQLLYFLDLYVKVQNSHTNFKLKNLHSVK